MTAHTLLDAMGGIDDRYILAAQKKLGLPAPVQTAHHRARRWAVCLAAVLALLMGSVTVAMAASPEFREAVFQFLGIGKTEIVPEIPLPETPQPELPVVAPQKADIGGVMEGTYVHTPVASYAASGVFLICADEMETKQGSTYDAYREENGALIQLETHTFRETVQVGRHDVAMDLQWTEVDGRTVITYMEPSAEYTMKDFSGSPEKNLFLFAHFDRETWETTTTPAFVNLRTGEVTETGLTLETLGEIHTVSASPDQTKLLLATAEGGIFYADLQTKTVQDVAALSGESLTDCSLVGDSLVCWREVGGSGAFRRVRGWAIDLTTLSRRELPVLSDRDTLLYGFLTPYSTGRMFAGSCFAIQRSGEETYLVDLAQGTETVMEGFTWPASFPEFSAWPSPDGRKLLICGDNSGGAFDSIALVDFDRNLGFQFSRENALREHSAYWFTNSSVLVRGEPGETATEYYVYSELGES